MYRSYAARSFAAALFLSVLSLVFPPITFAWATPASYTDFEIRYWVGTIELYRDEYGKLPPMENYWEELKRANPDDPNIQGQPRDRWDRPFVYRAPGKHGDFDFYSVGKDGIDNDGRRDDISNWAGVNDGYHWKSGWPLGRFAIGCGIFLGLGCLGLKRFYRWRTIAPLAGSFMSLGLALGCQLLMHPGKVPSRNTPLFLISTISTVAFFLFFTVWVAAPSFQRLAKRWRS